MRDNILLQLDDCIACNAAAAHELVSNSNRRQKKSQSRTQRLWNNERYDVCLNKVTVSTVYQVIPVYSTYSATAYRT